MPDPSDYLGGTLNKVIDWQAHLTKCQILFGRKLELSISSYLFINLVEYKIALIVPGSSEKYQIVVEL